MEWIKLAIIIVFALLSLSGAYFFVQSARSIKRNKITSPLTKVAEAVMLGVWLIACIYMFVGACLIEIPQ